MSDPPLEPDGQEGPADRVLADYLARIDAGEPVDRAALLEAHPHLAEELSGVFQAADRVDELAGPTQAELASRAEAGGHSPGSDRPRISLPRKFGEYELIEEIGAGGMGIVYKACHPDMPGFVAVKVMRSGTLATEREMKRFYGEARAAALLLHPNIINVHHYGEAEGRQFFSMEFVDGRDLGSLCATEVLDPHAAAELLITVAEAIHTAHEAGILHRDLKPENIVIDEHGAPQVTDFGLAKYLDDESRLTSTGAALGTPSYMSPEAAAGGELDVRSDVYSLGAVLYEVLTGCPPFRGRTSMDTVLSVLQDDPVPPTKIRSSVDPHLETIALKCLEKDPARRYPSARKLANDLRRYVEGRPIRASRMGAVRVAAKWLCDVPLVAALGGKKHKRAGTGHHAVQWTLIALLVAASFWLALRASGERPLPFPDEVRLAAAVPGGEYFHVGERIAPLLAARVDRPVHVLSTEGSLDNRARLLSGEAELALLQTSAIRAHAVSVIAPLYYDVVHLIARRDSNIQGVSELAGRRVSIGLVGSGMQSSALRLLQHYGLGAHDLVKPHVHFTALASDPSYAAAIVTTGTHNEDLVELLGTGAYRLLSLPDADRESLAGPTFRTLVLPAGTYTGISPAPVRTIATTTFLATVPRASSALVERTLATLYESDLVSALGFLSASEAAEWQMLDLHPAARRFYAEIAPGER